MSSGRIAVVGGGAAGMMAALAVRTSGGDAVIYERNPRVGIKIRISGGGKCNVTHAGSPREIESGFIQREARFLRHALHTLTPDDVIGMMEDEGVKLYTRPNGRVFPESGRSEQVLSAFESMLERAGVSVVTGVRVVDLLLEEGQVAGVVMEGGAVEPCSGAIVTTGGVSYPQVGTTGDGIDWGRRTGHTIITPRAALAPIYFPSSPPSDWQGVALRDIELRVERPGDGPLLPRNESYPTGWRDDLLLTHRGVSGPTALEVSRAAARAQELGHHPALVVDLMPDRDAEEIEGWLIERAAENGRVEIQNVVIEWVPRALIPAFLSAAGVEHGRRLAEITRIERQQLAATARGWRLADVGSVPIERGEVSAGGIALDEVNPKTMRSKHIPNLFFAGEVLDIAGSVGGYNLQAAFSTGWVAGAESRK